MEQMDNPLSQACRSLESVATSDARRVVEEGIWSIVGCSTAYSLDTSAKSIFTCGAVL